MDNNNISIKTKILGAVSFWFLGYSIIVLILFLLINFDVVKLKDDFLTLLSRPFLPVLLYIFPWFYIFPLLLAAAPSIKRLIFSIILSVPLFSFSFFPMFWNWAHGYAEEAITTLAGMIIQLILCFILSYVFINKKEKIIPKLLLISLVLFLSVFTYITILAKVASQAEPILRELSQEAIKAKDVSFCERILEESKKRYVSEFRIGSVVGDNYIECVQQIAVETGDVELCRKIDIGFADMRCIGLVAAKTSNPNLCDSEIRKGSFYSAEYYINECLEAYNSAK